MAIPKVSQLPSARPNISMAHELKCMENNKYATIEDHSSLKSPRTKISITHELKYTGMNTKCATTATEHSTYVPSPISNNINI
jgi:hypothetical protein